MNVLQYLNPINWGRSYDKPIDLKDTPKPKEDVKGTIPPGRVSEPDTYGGTVSILKDMTQLITPSFRTDLIPLIRALYKVNPDMGIALQDMFKLTNTGHRVLFPRNTPEEANKMREHLESVRKKWATYTAGIDGIVNKLIGQILVAGATSFEAVPNIDLNGIATVVFLNPEDIIFKRLNNGVYHPYQKNKNYASNKDPFIKLNTSTYKYSALFNDTDEPYGIPPFLTALDSIKSQGDMMGNFKHIMEVLGMVGFVEAKMQKPAKRADQSERDYERTLTNTLKQLKTNILGGLKDGVVAGYMDDHEFNLTSTSTNLTNVDKLWGMNQQSVANGLGVNGTIIGVTNTTNEGAAGILLSKMISQLKSIQMIIQDSLEFIYSLELLLAGFNNKGCKVLFNTSTITDEVKYQQAQEYKIRNNVALYNQGIISQEDFAFNMGYEEPDQKEPRVDPNRDNGLDSSAKKQKREADKDTSDRKTRDKNNPSPKRKDNETKPR